MLPVLLLNFTKCDNLVSNGFNAATNFATVFNTGKSGFYDTSYLWYDVSVAAVSCLFFSI